MTDRCRTSARWLAAGLACLMGWLLVLGVPGWAAGGSLRQAAPESSTAWRWPLDGVPRVTRRFDPPDTLYGRGHRGVDLAGTPGGAVHAAGAGRIGYAGSLAGRGVVTVLHTNGLRTTYEPLRPQVRAGQRVALGEVIGRLDPGHAGCPLAACLHWGLLRGDTYLDPLTLMHAGRVRLLPLDAASPRGAAPPAPMQGSVGHADPPAPLRSVAAVGALATLAVGAVILIRRRPP